MRVHSTFRGAALAASLAAMLAACGTFGGGAWKLRDGWRTLGRYDSFSECQAALMKRAEKLADSGSTDDVSMSCSNG